MNEELMEKGTISVSPEIVKPKGGVGRNSTGKTNTRASLSLSNSNEKLLPHYLRASTSSCHEFCKYGRKHAFETKGKHVILSKFFGNNAIPDEDHNQVKRLSLGERRKKPVIKLKTTSQSKTGYSNKPKVIQQKALSPAKETGSFEEPVSIKLDNPSPESIASADPNVPPTFFGNNATPDREPNQVKSFDVGDRRKIPVNVKLETPSLIPDSRQNQVKSLNLGDRRKKQVVKLKTSPQLKAESSNKPKVVKQKDSSRSNEFDSSRKLDNIKQKTPPPVKKDNISVKPKLIKQRTLSSVKKNITSATPKVIKQKAWSPPKRLDVSARLSISLKPKIPLEKSASLSNHSGGLTGRRYREKKISKSVSLSKVGEKKVLRPPTVSLSPKPPVNGVSNFKLRNSRNMKPYSTVKNQQEVGNAEKNEDMIEEKTSYVIHPKPEHMELEPIHQNLINYQSSPSSQTLPSTSSLSSSPSLSSQEAEEHEESEFTITEVSESDFENEEAESNYQVEVLKDEEKRGPRRAATVHPEDNSPTPHKLKFRRGKVLNLQSENNGPRRLRFRQGRVVSETQNEKGEVGRRSFRRRKHLGGRDSKNPNLEAQTVVLRHQDMQGKKDTQGLFNHVIEETASKLVETRKSKVKALVGAFETVISLQESKPPSTV